MIITTFNNCIFYSTITIFNNYFIISYVTLNSFANFSTSRRHNSFCWMYYAFTPSWHNGFSSSRLTDFADTPSIINNDRYWPKRWRRSLTAVVRSSEIASALVFCFLKLTSVSHSILLRPIDDLCHALTNSRRCL